MVPQRPVARPLQSRGDVAGGLELVDGIQLGELSYPPLTAEIGLRRGSLLSEAGRHAEALTELTAALHTALASGHDIPAATIATRRDFVRAARLQQAHEVLGDAPIVDGLVDGMPARTILACASRWGATSGVDLLTGLAATLRAELAHRTKGAA